tara:strand:- start:2044 stop:3228 length:1185 start_codon:yes stop_codon:yes gene_type:complete
MPKSIYVYTDPTITTSADGDTPFGLYDADETFVSESVEVCKYVARKMGHPVMQLEIPSSSMYACFEEAVSDYSTYINNYNIRNWMWEHYGNSERISGSDAGSTGSHNPIKPGGGAAVYLSDKYGTQAGVGGEATLHTGSITLSEKQVYDIPTEASFSNASHSNKRIEVQTMFNYGPSAVTRFYDPFAGSFEQRNMLDNFGMGNVAPAVSFILRPIYQDVTRAQAIETNDKIRKAQFSFELVNNKLRLFPIPQAKDVGDKVWFQYYVREEKNSLSSTYTTGKTTDPSNVPYKFITYNEINSVGRQWIRRYTLALSKELLGIVRSKYSSMPIPNGEVSLDGEALKAEGREEKNMLIEELKLFLESVSITAKAEMEATEAAANSAVLGRTPLKIYIG